MESMRDIRNRMNSVQKTMRITNAMYLMASSKLKRARKLLGRVEPYFKWLQSTIVDILAHTEVDGSRYLATDREIPPEEVKHGYVIITSDKGLAGSYNHNVIQLAIKTIRENGGQAYLSFIGFSGLHYFQRHPEYGKILEELCVSAVEPSIWRTRSIAEQLMEDFLNGDLDEIHVVYTKMVNALTAEAEVVQILPLAGKMFPYDPEEDTADGDYQYKTEYRPSPEAVLDKIVPNYVKGILFGALNEAYAAEQNARMMAMDNATKNAGEIVKSLSLQYNRVRQAAITTELTEVVAGASAQEE